MPLTRFKLSAIEDGGIATADLADGAVTTDKLADSAVTSVKTSNLFTNTEIAGTEAARMPVGTTAQRANAQSGDIRFNSTLDLMEYYDGTQWKSIDSPPTISSADVSDFDAAGDTITLTGSNFQSGMTIKLVGDDGTEYSASSVTVTNSTTASFDITSAMATDNDPFDIVVTNASGLSGTLANALDFAPTPAFSTASGSIGTIYDSLRSSYSLSAVTATSTDADDTLSYALGSGDSLPAGLSLNSSTGAITGTATAVGSDTTTTFDIVATATSTEDNGTTTNTREFSITVKAPVINSYTSTGSSTFNVPTGIAAVDVLVVGGGGGAGDETYSGGGGGGGVVYTPQHPVTPQGTVSYTVGSGGGANTSGQNSVFGSITAYGGGAGGEGHNGDAGSPSQASGGGGGGGSWSSPGPQSRGTGGPQGNPGGDGSWNPGVYTAGGGGGGAGSAGGSANNGQVGGGGSGTSNSISGSPVYYGSGAPGGAWPSNPWWPGGLNQAGTGATTRGGQGTANRGAGGSGQSIQPSNTGNTGGSGIIIVKY